MCLGCHYLCKKEEKENATVFAFYVCEISLERLTGKWIGKLPLGRTGGGWKMGCGERKEFFFFFLPHLAAGRTLVSQPGIEPQAPAVKVPSPNHWTVREFPLRILNLSREAKFMILILPCFTAPRMHIAPTFHIFETGMHLTIDDFS